MNSSQVYYCMPRFDWMTNVCLPAQFIQFICRQLFLVSKIKNAIKGHILETLKSLDCYDVSCKEYLKNRPLKEIWSTYLLIGLSIIQTNNNQTNECISNKNK